MCVCVFVCVLSKNSPRAFLYFFPLTIPCLVRHIEGVFKVLIISGDISSQFEHLQQYQVFNSAEVPAEDVSTKIKRSPRNIF